MLSATTSAPIGKSKASSFDDSDIYTLPQVLAVVGHAKAAIDFKKHHIFLESDASGLANLKTVLKLMPWHTDLNSNLQSLTKALETRKHSVQLYNLQLQEARAELEKIKATPKKAAAKESEVSPTETRLLQEISNLEQLIAPITSDAWAVMCKWSMLRGIIFDFSSKKVHAALRILLFKLRDCKTEQPSVIFKEFIGQLCLIGQYQTAEVIHRYINLAKLILDKSAENNMNADQVAFTLAPGLLEGLTLLGQFNERKAGISEEDRLFNERAYASEIRIFKNLFRPLLDDPLFWQDFHPALYRDFKQGNFQAEVAVVKARAAEAMRAELWGSYVKGSPAMTDLTQRIEQLNLSALKANEAEDAEVLRPPSRLTPRADAKRDQIRAKSPRSRPRIESKDLSVPPPAPRGVSTDNPRTSAPGYNLLATLQTSVPQNTEEGSNPRSDTRVKKKPL